MNRIWKIHLYIAAKTVTKSWIKMNWDELFLLVWIADERNMSTWQVLQWNRVDVPFFGHLSSIFGHYFLADIISNTIV